MSAVEQSSKQDLLTELVYSLYTQAETMCYNDYLRIEMMNDYCPDNTDEDKRIYLHLYELWKHNENSCFISMFLEMTKKKSLIAKQEKITRAVMIDILRNIN